jgi:hypothetical protein
MMLIEVCFSELFRNQLYCSVSISINSLGFYTSSTDLRSVNHLSVYQERNELQSQPKKRKGEADPPENDGNNPRMEYFAVRLHLNAQYGRKVRPSHRRTPATKRLDQLSRETKSGEKRAIKNNVNNVY